MTTTRQRLLGLLATCAVVAGIAGLPILMLAIDAGPVLGEVPTVTELKSLVLAPDDGRLLLGLMRVVVWAAWLVMALLIVVEIGSRLRGARAPRIPGLGRPQSAARGLVAVAALLFVAAPAATQAVGAGAPAAAAHSAALHTSQDEYGTEQAGGAHDSSQATTTATSTVQYAVGAGESLWSIAETELGDGSRFQEIVDLNRDVVGGDAGFLQPGWVLTIPADSASVPASADGAETVVPGDTLWDIAEEALGEGKRYPEIFDANKGVVQPDGRRLTDPDLILPGWQLDIPGAGSFHQDDPQPPVPRLPDRPDGPHLDHAADESGAVPTEVRADSTLEAPWVLAGLVGGGMLLAGSLQRELVRRRREQLRARRPGRTIALPEPELAPVEMTVAAAGGPAVASVEYLDTALRRLAANRGRYGGAMPRVAAVELGTATVTLHLTEPADLAAPWQGTADRLNWVCPTGLEDAELGPETGNVEAPYPLLVTVGCADDGEEWLFNCEELGTVTISGDRARGRSFARHLAAQIAVNPWSRSVRLDCMGVAEEVLGMADAITYHSRGAGAEAMNPARDHADDTADRAAWYGADVSTARTGELDEDSCPARMVLVDSVSNVNVNGDVGLDDLLELVDRNGGRCATSVLVADEGRCAQGVVLQLTAAGRVVIEQAGLDLVAVGLSSEEARDCAALFARADVLDDVAVPVDDTATDGWEALADQAGAIRREYTLPRDIPTIDVGEPARSLLEGADEDYLRASAVVQRDLEELAPKVKDDVRAQVEDDDPGLDQDVTDWFDPDGSRPRLSLLGPVAARTRGRALAKRKPYFTELLAFLALRRRHGATNDEVSDAFGITPAKVREYVRVVRDWLGDNPRTGDPHLPHADKAPAAQTRGVNVYQVDTDLLIDVDLFRRLRVRGEARGGDAGLADLDQALALVTGRPFDQLRPGGWAWLLEGERHDLYLAHAIADVALLVTTHCLATGELGRARDATEVAVIAAPDEEAAQLCRTRIAEAEGDHAAADRILRNAVCNPADDDDPPAELSERTQSIIAKHHWLAS